MELSLHFVFTYFTFTMWLTSRERSHRPNNSQVAAARTIITFPCFCNVQTLTLDWRPNLFICDRNESYIGFAEWLVRTIWNCIQNPKKVFARGLVNFGPAVAYLFYLNLPAALSWPHANTFFGLCRITFCAPLQLLFNLLPYTHYPL